MKKILLFITIICLFVGCTQKKEAIKNPEIKNKEQLKSEHSENVPINQSIISLLLN